MTASKRTWCARIAFWSAALAHIVFLPGCDPAEEVAPGSGSVRLFEFPLELSAELPVSETSLPVSEADCEALVAWPPVWQFHVRPAHGHTRVFSIGAVETEFESGRCLYSAEPHALSVLYAPTESGDPQNLAEIRILQTAAFTVGETNSKPVFRWCRIDLPPPETLSEGDEYGPFAYFTLEAGTEQPLDAFLAPGGMPPQMDSCTTGVLASDPRSYP